MSARDDYPVLAEAARNAQLHCWTEAAAALVEIDRLREAVAERAMSERPTPEEIVTESALAADDWGDWVPSDMLDALAAHGYRIVHPDDVPEMERDDDLYLDAPYGAGYNACRAHIFGEGS